MADIQPQKNPPAPQKTDAPKYPARAFVRTTSGGEMLHLYTNERITSEGKKIDIDHFAVSQIEAGKWEIFEPK